MIQLERHNRLIARDGRSKPFDDTLLKTLDIDLNKIDFNDLALVDEVITLCNGDRFNLMPFRSACQVGYKTARAVIWGEGQFKGTSVFTQT